VPLYLAAPGEEVPLPLVNPAAWPTVSKLKVFNFGSVDWRPDPALYLDVVIAAESLTSAKRLLADAGFDKPKRFFPNVDRAAEELALANVGRPVWLDIDNLDGGWHVGGRGDIEAYRGR
jgi:hypothetical protein